MWKLWIDLLKLFYPTLDETNRAEVIGVTVGLVGLMGLGYLLMSGSMGLAV